MEANLPWTLVLIGVGIAVAVEILGIPVLPFAVGLYLPIHLSAGIMVGGLIRLYFQKKKKITEEKRKDATERGILYTSGLIAGEGLVGVLLAILAIIPIGKLSLGEFIDLSRFFDFPGGEVIRVVLAFAVFALLLFTLFKMSLLRKEKKSSK